MRSALLTASLCKIQLVQCISKLLGTDGLTAYIQLLASALEKQWFEFQFSLGVW